MNFCLIMQFKVEINFINNQKICKIAANEIRRDLKMFFFKRIIYLIICLRCRKP